MNRRLTALFAAFEAVLVLAIGVAIPLVPLTMLWGFQFGLAIDWTVFWRTAVDIWLVGHGVDVTFILDPDTAGTLGLLGADAPITVTIAALGFALLTVLLGVRAGRRVAETRYSRIGELVSLAAFALASFGVTFSALHPLARPSLVQGTLLPTLVFAVGLVIGVGRARAELDAAPGPLRRWLATWPPQAYRVAVAALRGGTAAAAAVLTLAALLTALALTVSYAKLITLYEGLHTEVLGGIAVTLGQLAFLPNAVIWAASWLVGPGFAIGTGSTVSPLATQLGPIPAIPLLGALPSGELPFGFLGLLVPVIAGFLVGAILGVGARRPADSDRGVERRGELGGPQLAVAALGVGVVGGIILGLLAWASAGAIGPGRLVDVGPNPWAVGGWAAVELALSALIGATTSLRRTTTEPRRPQR